VYYCVGMSRSQRLAELIKRIQGKRKRLTLARAIGVTRHTLIRWESGEGSAEMRGGEIKLSAYLGTTVEDLENYLDGKTSLQDLLKSYRDDEISVQITVGRVLAWLPTLSLYELGLIVQTAGEIFVNRTTARGIQKLIEQELNKPNRAWSNCQDRANKLEVFATENFRWTTPKPEADWIPCSCSHS
jgi:DNA-binding XRE family transcriptional regulator